jgi:adenylate cyclase, class 2
MSREIELKARIVDPIDMKARIMALDGISAGEQEHKADIYFIRPGEKKHFRVRLMDDSVTVTHKEKETALDGTEENHEIEFDSEIQNYQNILDFFTSLGYVEYIRKEKTGWVWNRGPVVLELIEVSSLGWFVEMEIILGDDATSEAVIQAKKLLFTLLEELGIGRECLEDRYYMDLLREKT